MTIDTIGTMAASMAASGLFGKNKEQLFSLMLIAQAEGIHPAIAAQEYDVIQGRPAITARAALARFQAAGGSIKYLARTDAECKVWAHHPRGGELVVTWTIEQARKAGLADKDNWKKNPRAMLSARATAEVIRAVYPACLNRMYTADEAADMEPAEMRDVTPPEAEPEPIPIIFDPDALRSRLEELKADPCLVKAGREQIEAELAREDATAEELFALVEKAEKNIATVKAKRVTAAPAKPEARA
jgi:hypothetical protein